MAVIEETVTGVGYLDELTLYPSGSSLDAVDDTYNSHDGSGSFTNGAGDSYYTFPTHENLGTIVKVTVIGVWQETNASDDPKIYIRTHSTNYLAADPASGAPSPAVWTTTSVEYTTNPNTGSAWTWDEVNAMEIGLHSYSYGKGSFTAWTAAWRIIEYTPPVDAGGSILI